MERLTALDAGFLQAEDADRHISLAVGGLAVLDGPMPDYVAIVDAMSARLLQVPRFRQVVHFQPLDLEAPEWRDDPHLDIGHHIHHAALPHPGDDAALFRFAAEVMEQRLDRDRPLWQCWILEGLADDRWAILMKIHHCIADGIATMRLLTGLSDDGGHDTYLSEVHAAKHTVLQADTHSSISLNPLRWVGGAYRTATGVAKAAAVTVEGTLEILDGLIRTGQESPFLGEVSAMRRFSAAEVSLDTVAEICDTFDVTLNDVALAAITDSFRAAFLRRGREPQRTSLRTLVPVSTRTRNALDRTDNRVSVMIPYLPVDKPDPVEQLRVVHRRLNRVKAGNQRRAASTVLSAIRFVPFAVSARVVRTVTGLPQRGIVTLATNVPGPRRRLRIAGHDVVRMLPIPPMALGMRTAVAILSYDDRLVFGIASDFDAVPDVDELARGIETATERLAAAAPARSATAEAAN
ncbi:wax ester/triacylglycerol synthase family O-acyltransferase [Mycobacterium sp. GA-2829]|uniref:WS/DGAT/MGAT family O-acyltransferase n=1 Tax=Mycobacterium sp. GA-2829 TaxID=1772283 RepID=UPI0007401E88|nr:wax ester/triacylglycerol synthase family O-acyltransferase [Mycobacterium sp. GA-2829]KUI32631.1 diacylglycerol O-acyltransferase [Mycobacterium sp. GA-2829]